MCYVCMYFIFYRSSGAVRTSHLPSVHQLLKAEPMQVQGMKQTIVELPLQPKKEFVPQLATSASSNFPSGSKYHKKHVPKYTTPFPSPTTSQPTSPVIRNEKKSSSHNNQRLLSSSTNKQVKGQIYDLNKMAAAVTNSNSTTAEISGGNFKRHSEGWWNCLSLPASNHNALVGMYTPGVLNPPSADPLSSSVMAARRVSLPNLTLPSSVSSVNSIITTLSPMMASPTSISPLGGSKNRTAR